MIQAIETQYAGYRFRSRLEARWAVLLDTLGQRWEYEPEGFHTPHGGYLPDFKIVDIPGWHVWLEVKAIEPTPIEIAKLLAIADGHDAFFACGPPELAMDAEGRACVKVLRVAPGYAWSGVFQPYGAERLNDAVIAARSARFEHGESGGGRIGARLDISDYPAPSSGGPWRIVPVGREPVLERILATSPGVGYRWDGAGWVYP